MEKYNTRLLVSMLLGMLSGCTAGLVPVIDLNDAAYGSARAGGTVHIVSKGESLHSIAWRYGLNYRQLAAANGIAIPYTIYPNQRLSLRQRAQPVKATSPARLAVTRVAPAPSRPAVVKLAPAPSRPASTPTVSTLTGGAWHWPTQGVVARYNGLGRKKGIDINGRSGQAVFPAKGGKVVYAGNGIRGYGNLLIVKHDAEYLSAYAYNKRVLVAEGDQVEVGQKIAELGRGPGRGPGRGSGTGQSTAGAAQEAKLYFEIRRAGKAVDPLSLLPKRQNNVKI